MLNVSVRNLGVAEPTSASFSYNSGKGPLKFSGKSLINSLFRASFSRIVSTRVFVVVGTACGQHVETVRM
jgi:hypothetical protein